MAALRCTGPTGRKTYLRLEDLTDCFKLRRIANAPWQVLRFRKTQRPGQSLRVELRDGPPLFLRGGYADFHMFHRIFLRDEYRLGGYSPGSWHCVLDLGANVGLFAVRAARLARRVIAVEPSPENFAMLRRNVAKRKAIEAVQAAVAARCGTIRLYRPRLPGLSGAHSAYAGRAHIVSEDFDEVPSTTLDEIFNSHGIDRCDLVKIDVEGMEYEVLQSASKGTLQAIQRIHGEYHDVEGDDPSKRIEALQVFLSSHGFVVERVPHRKKVNHGMFFAGRPGTD